MVSSSNDLRGLSKAGLTQRLLGAFDALEPGGTVELLAGGDHRPIVLLLGLERPGQFDCSLLELAPSMARLELHRRPTPGPRSVEGYLVWDHRRLDALLEGSEALADSGDLEAAARRFAEFATGLDRHIRMEEHVLYPTFEAKAKPTSAIVEDLLAEHVEIRQLLSDIAASLEDKNATLFEQLMAHFYNVMGGHNAEEEALVYGQADRAVGGPTEQDALVTRMMTI